MKAPSSAEIAGILTPYCPAVDERLANQVAAYIPLLLEWNRKISLTAVTDPTEIAKFHFGESLFAGSALKIREGRLADVGSGAGFPGLPLAMANLGLEVTLIEANAKKAAFLSEASRRLGIKNAVVSRNRMEDIAGPVHFDFICARALGNYARLLDWSRRHLDPAGKVVLFLGRDDAETLSKNGEWSWGVPMRVPGSDRRFLLTGAPA